MYVCLFTSVWQWEQRVNMEAPKTDVGGLPQLLSVIEATEAVELSWTQNSQIWLVYLPRLLQGSSVSFHFLSTGIIGKLPPGVYMSSGNPNVPILTLVWQALYQPSYPSFSTSCKSFALYQELCGLVCSLQEHYAVELYHHCLTDEKSERREKWSNLSRPYISKWYKQNQISGCRNRSS